MSMGISSLLELCVGVSSPGITHLPVTASQAGPSENTCSFQIFELVIPPDESLYFLSSDV